MADVGRMTDMIAAGCCEVGRIGVGWEVGRIGSSAELMESLRSLQ